MELNHEGEAARLDLRDLAADHRRAAHGDQRGRFGAAIAFEAEDLLAMLTSEVVLDDGRTDAAEIVKT